MRAGEIEEGVFVDIAFSDITSVDFRCVNIAIN
jgi:hypothetical protein